MWPTSQEAGPMQSVNFSWRSIKYPSHLQVQLHSFGSKAEAATSPSFIVIVKVILRFRFEIGVEEGSPSAHRFLLPPGRGPCPSNWRRPSSCRHPVDQEADLQLHGPFSLSWTWSRRTIISWEHFNSKNVKKKKNAYFIEKSTLSDVVLKFSLCEGLNGSCSRSWEDFKPSGAPWTIMKKILSFFFYLKELKKCWEMQCLPTAPAC